VRAYAVEVPSAAAIVVCASFGVVLAAAFALLLLRDKVRCTTAEIEK
jgi:uncharacterized membrane protein